jgi:uncharacterized protein YbdZ (MbtH family)
VYSGTAGSGPDRGRYESAELSAYYRVIVNDEGCYCIWPREIAVPLGWTTTGFSSTGEVALNQVAELWRAKIAMGLERDADS